MSDKSILHRKQTHESSLDSAAPLLETVAFRGRSRPSAPKDRKLSLVAADRVLVLAVHPDDESLCAGGLIQHAVACGAAVRVVFVTDGDDNPWPQRFVERRWRITPADRARWGQRRRDEAKAALACLGVPEENAEFWGFPDQGITGILMLGGGELLSRLYALLGEWWPSVVVGPSKDDLHPDHNSLAVLVDTALSRLEPSENRAVVWEYLVHGGPCSSAVDEGQLVLSPQQVATKRRAILHHQTQTALSRARFVAFAKPVESFRTQDTTAETHAGPRLEKAELVDDALVLKMDRIRCPAVILVLAENAHGAPARVIRIPRIGHISVDDAFSDDLPARPSLRDGNTLVLPAGSFAPATAIAVKFVRGWGIFDRCGWQSVPLIRLPEDDEALVAPPRTCCVIPCYNIAEVCGAVVRDAARYADTVIAVNDGSTDETESVLSDVAQEFPGRIQVLSFARNRGKGVVLIEAFRHALATSTFDVLVTLDGDGQHRPEDIPRLARALTRGRCPLVIGERLARSRMPFRSWFGNTLTALVMRAFYPAAPIDTQSGLRAFRPDFVREIVERIEGGRYETEMKILLLALTREFQIGSVTIPTVYIGENRLSHFRPLVDSWRIYRTLLSWRSGAAHSRRRPFLDARPGAGSPV